MKQVKYFTVGETVIDQGKRFIIERIVAMRNGQIAFIDTAGVWHGAYSPEEYLGVADD